MKKKLFLVLCLFVGTIAAAQKKEQPIRVSCIGNSITYGSGLKQPELYSYPSQLQGLLGEKYEVGNFGKPGATLLRRAFRPYDKQEEFQKAMDFHGDIAVIHLGINDTSPLAWPNYKDEFFHDYTALIDSVRKSNPKVRIIVARMTPLPDRHPRFLSGTRDWHAQIQKAIEQVAELNGCELIDFHAPLYHRPDLIPDAIHPNREGYAIMAQVVYSAITGDYGGLALPPFFTDNMVLPRNRSFQIQGRANAGDEVTLRINGQRHKARTGGDGTWTVTINPLPSGGPYTLTATTKDKTIELTNVMAGELWLCSGQSNMTFQLRQCATGREDIPHSTHPLIRLLNLEGRWEISGPITWDKEALEAINRLGYFTNPTWQECTPETSPRFSAIGYYFACELQDSLQCPIGIINNAIGGSGTEDWIDRATIEYEFPEILRDWAHNDFLQDWVRGRIAMNLGKDHDALQRHPYQPCYLYEAGIWPLRSLPIDGVIWYQGESNAHNMEAHERLFHLLIKSWRETWQQPNLPFYYVQLSSHNRPSWPWFRDSQRRLMTTVSHSGMAVCSDIGDSLDVHPRQKRQVGHRLAAWALHKDYGYDKIVPSGPLFRSVEFKDGSAWISFDYADGLQSSDGAPLRTFEVAEHDGQFYPAEATIVGDRVRVSSRKVKHPRYVRYGWQPFTRANLVNGVGLPASTFRGE